MPRSFRRHTDYETMRLHRGCSPNGATDKFRLLPRATPGAKDRELLPRELLPVQQAGSYSRELLPVQQAGSYSRLLPSNRPGATPDPWSWRWKAIHRLDIVMHQHNLQQCCTEQQSLKHIIVYQSRCYRAALEASSLNVCT